jgi:uncharacterized protein YraI
MQKERKMYRKYLLTAGIVMSLLLLVVIPAAAQDATSTPQPAASPEPTAAPAPLTASTAFFATANFRVNVRSGPGTEYTVLGQAQPGDALDITGRRADNRWLRVNFNGQEGWVSAALFDVTGDVATAPESVAGATAVLRTTPAQTTATQLGDVMVITRVNSNLRATPSVNGDLLTTIPFNTTLEVLARNATNNWVQVNFDNQTGWISSGLLFFQQGDIATVQTLDESGNVVQPQTEATAQPAAEPTIQPTAST